MEEEIAGELILSEGKEVEVTSDEEGYRGAWYGCTIIKQPVNKAKGKVLVQYKHLVEGDYQTPLTESLDLSWVRSLPPQTQISDETCFQLNDVVDAFHLDGWWTGSVSKLLDDNPKRYLVSFVDPPEVIEFSSSNLRPHWNWVNGKWVKPSKVQEVSSIQLESSDATKSSSKRHKLLIVNYRKNGTLLQKASQEPVKSKPVKRKTPEGDAARIRTSKKFKHGSLANSSFPESGSKRSVFRRCLQKKYGTRIKFNDEDPKKQNAEKMDNTNVAAASEVSDVLKVTKEVEPSVTRGLPIECMSASATEKYSHVHKQAILDKSLLEMNMRKEHGTGRHKKENGLLEIEQAKSVLQTTQSPSVDINAGAGAGVLEEMVPEVYKAWVKKRMEVLHTIKLKRVHKKSGIGRHKKEVGLLETKQPKSVLQRTQSPSVDINAASDGVLEDMVPKEHKATEVELSAISGLERPGSQTMLIESTDSQRKIIKVTGESGGNLHENEELQLGDFPPGFEKQCNDPREKPLELMVQSPLVCLTGGNEPEKGQDLPFVKSLPVWNIVESMEIFKVMPQNPHFHPLVKSKEILREGLAFGHMLSFASLVQKTSKLTVVVRRELYTSILDALPEFKILGFDVNAVRDRTSKLLSVKDRYGDIQNYSKEVEQQVEQCSDELSKINKEIDANYKMVRELEEKQALLLSRKDFAISRISSLEVCADDTTKGIQKVEVDFESLAGSTW